MIDRQHGNIIFECDSCDETLATDTANFADAWNEAKRDGWRAKKIGKDWVHSCPECEP